MKGEDRRRQFLAAFAAILEHSNYQLALDHYIRMSAKCSRCATTCQVYQVTGDSKDMLFYRMPVGAISLLHTGV